MARPDELLTDIERSVFGRALVVSIILHAVLIGATSISLFKDWTEYGVHSPSWINAEKTKARKEAEETRRREEAEKKAAAEEAKAAEMPTARRHSVSYFRQRAFACRRPSANRNRKNRTKEATRKTIFGSSESSSRCMNSRPLVMLFMAKMMTMCSSI